MVILIYILCAVLAVLLGIYFFATRSLYNLTVNLLRRKGRMRLETIKVGADNWPYLVGGPATGETVVLLHGFGADKDAWPVYAENLTKKYRVIAPDLPGYGNNTKDPERDYSVSSHVEYLKPFLEALNVSRCHLGGNSMGGFIALQFSMEYPDFVQSLTLFDNAGVLGADDSQLLIDVKNGKNPLQIDNPDDLKRMMAFAMHKPPFVPKQIRKLLYNDFTKQREFLNNIFWGLADDLLTNPLNTRLHEVKAPTLIIWGREDQLVHVSCIEVLSEGIETSRSVILEETGHVPMVEKPKLTAGHHLPFLAEHKAGTT